MIYENNELFERIKELNLIPAKELDKALKEAQDSGKQLHEIILKKELISDSNLARLMADMFGVKFVTLAQENIDQTLMSILPEIVAKKQKIILIDRVEKGLRLAMADPTNKEVVQLLEKKTGEKVIPHLATLRDIEDNLVIYSQELQQTFDDLIEESIKAAEGTTSEAPVRKIVNTLIEFAFKNKSSDLHIEPEETDSIVRFRIDGVLHDVLKLPKNLHDQVITRVKVMANLRTDEHLSAQDGKIEINLEREDLDLRVSIVPVTEGEKCVLRLLSESARSFALQELGMNDMDLEKVKKAYSRPHGMVLSTGPTGSGKTTTIYAILKIVNSRNVNIATIEDPVEYDMQGVNQIQVNPKTNLTFAHGLRSILRQDPDIIFVGEIRDQETSGIAVNAAMTGHLVLSTLHTNDSATTLPRLIDMGTEPFLVASTVNVIIAQRLVRKICNTCKISFEQPRKDFEKQINKNLMSKYFGNSEVLRIYKGKGCEVCHSTGYDGRIGVFEVMEISDSLRKLITQKANADDLKTQAVAEGMTTMLEDGLDKVTKGVTTLEEVLRVTTE